MSKCTGCDNHGYTPHTLDCLFGHFMSYTGGYNETAEIQQKLRIAYEHGHEAGEAS